jgi:hypothetical protein
MIMCDVHIASPSFEATKANIADITLLLNNPFQHIIFTVTKSDHPRIKSDAKPLSFILFYPH